MRYALIAPWLICKWRGSVMQYSLRLIAERLCSKGFHALAMNDRGVSVKRVRLLPSDGKLFEADTLYVYAGDLESYTVSAIDTSEADLMGATEKSRVANTSCAFAFSQMPKRGWREPSLVIEGVSDLGALLGAIADIVDELDDAFAQINELAWQEDGLNRIVELLSRLLGNPVYIVDSSFKVMAIVDDPDMEEMSVNWMNAAKRGYLSYDVIANLVRSNELHDIESPSTATVVKSEFFYTPFANLNLRLKGKVQGHLFVVQMYHAITSCDLELIDRVAPIVLRAMQADPSYQVRRGPLYEHFVVDWLEGTLRDPGYISSQLNALSFNADDLSVVAVIRLSVSSEFRREHLARLLEDRKGCRAVSHDGHVIALFQLKHHKEKAAVLHKIKDICRSQRCHAAVSDVQDGFLDTPRAYRQARETMRICDAMGFEDAVVCYGDVAAYQPYLNFSSTEELEAFCHPAIMALREHDRTHAVQLLPTLSAFLKNDRDVQATADVLYVHRNTLSYRMKRIVELCPLDLNDFTVRHRLLESILIIENYDGITAHLKRSP